MRTIRVLSCLVLTVLATGLPSPRHGAALAQAGGAGKIAPPSSPIERVLPEPQPRAEPRLLPPPEAPPPEGEGTLPVVIGAIEITGATVYRTDELAGFSVGIVGQAVSQDRVAQIVRDIQAKYRNEGYFLTVVRGTVDRVNDVNVLHVRVVEGFISDVKIEGDIGPAGVLVYNFLNRLTQYHPVSIAEVERALLLVQGIPGISARAVLRPGAGEVGAVELIAQVGRKAFGAVANYDNRGSTFAGTSELLVSGYASSFTSLGEQTELTIFDTPLTDEQAFTQLASEFYVGSDGLKVRGYYGFGLSEPGGSLAGTGFKSWLYLAGVSASYPIIRTRPLSLTANAAFDGSRSTIALAGQGGVRQRNSVTNLRVFRVGGTLDFQDDTLGLDLVGANSFSATVHKGIVGLGSSRNNSPLAARAGSRDAVSGVLIGSNIIDFAKLTGELTRVQNLFDLDNFQFALKLSIAGQYTKDVLPPNEKFFLGGTRYGRGFFSGEITGDRAIGETAELQINTNIEGILNVGLQYYLFYDTARTMDLGQQDVNHKIQSAGAGLRVDLTPQLSGELEVARRFTRNPSGASGPGTNSERAETVFVRLVGRY